MPATSLWDKLQEIGPRAGRLELLKRHPGNWWDDIAQALGASALGPSGNALTPYDFGGTPGALVDNTEPLAEWLTALEAESVAGGPKSTTMGCLPPGLWITEDELYLQQQGITLLCHGATLMQADYAELPHVLTIGVPTSGMEQTDSTYRCGIHALNINGNSDYNAKEWAGGAGRSALRLFDAGRTHIDHVRVYKSTALGVLEDCSVNPAGSSAGNTSIITNTQVQFAASGGFKFLGAKNSTYANLQADNCYCGETQAASEAAPGFWWRARSFSDTDGDGLGDGPSETTQCIVSNCKSSNNGGHGFVFDGMAKYTVSNLNSNANTLCGYMLQNTVLDEVDPDPASLTTATAAISGAWSNLSSRRDGDDKDVIGLDVADNVYVTALTITGLNIIGGSSSLWSGSDKLGLGARVRGLNGLTLTGLSITNAPGTGLVVEKGSLVSPLTPADRETTRLNIGNFKIASCGSTEVNAYATCHGIHVKDDASQINLHDGYVGNSETSGGNYELKFDTSAAGVNSLYSSLVLEAQTLGNEISQAASNTAVKTQRFRNIVTGGDVETLPTAASADLLHVPPEAHNGLCLVLGNTTINNMYTPPAGTRITLEFDEACTMNAGSALDIAGTLSAVAGTVIEMISNGTFNRELSRRL